MQSRIPSAVTAENRRQTRYGFAGLAHLFIATEPTEVAPSLRFFRNAGC